MRVNRNLQFLKLSVIEEDTEGEKRETLLDSCSKLSIKSIDLPRKVNPTSLPVTAHSVCT